MLPRTLVVVAEASLMEYLSWWGVNKKGKKKKGRVREGRSQAPRELEESGGVLLDRGGETAKE
jgi:hypothetical protein